MTFARFVRSPFGQTRSDIARFARLLARVAESEIQQFQTEKFHGKGGFSPPG